MKILFITIIATMFGSAGNAQKISSDKVPLATKAAFEKAHPGALATWEKEVDNFEVNFKEAGKSMSAVIDKSGNILETESDIAVSALPASAATYVQAHYKGSAIKEASMISKANGDIMYEANVNGRDLMFDASGKFIKSVKE